MKRPPGIWFLLSAGVLWLSIDNVYGLKATEIIFKKTTSTTTTTAIPIVKEQLTDDVPTDTPEASNATKSPLIGIPQIDYIYDPNLPRELNGYNLSTYPFYNTLPDNITFKCEGLHDGFYASIPHKCQVYHHCLSDIRYDFLCANYTAFDQTIFNCHFVSEVDCENSHKFWHRNDALYKSASTTTTTVQPTPIVISPALTGIPKRPPPPLNRRRTPSRRRPEDDYRDTDYYDDEYDDDKKDDYYEPPPRRRRKRPRPRPRPRPSYDDDYEEYEDKREQRGSARRTEDRRREYDDDDRHMIEKPNDRRTIEDKYEGRNNKRKPYDDRRYKDERRREYEQDEEDDDYNYKRRTTEKRRPYYERPRKPQRRPQDEDFYDDEKDDDRQSQKGRPHTIPKVQRPRDEDLNEDKKDDGRHMHKERPHTTSKTQPENDGVALVKPHGPSSVYNQPRVPPRIKPPVIKNTPKTTTSSEKPVTLKTHTEDEEYYDDYEDVVTTKTTTTTTKAPEPEVTSKRSKFRTTSKAPLYDEEYSDDDHSPPPPPPSPTLKKVGVSGEREISTRFTSPKFVPKEIRVKVSSTTSAPTTTSTTTTRTTTTTTTKATTTDAFKERSEPIVRVVKRPFLPSRGGNPYLVRGLQPVGAKALDTSNYESNVSDVTEMFENHQSSVQNGRQFPISPALKEPLSVKPIAVIQPDLEPAKTKIPLRLKPNIQKVEEQNRVKPNVPDRNPLDINENEYDVTLNDALNPTIPNLPVRSFPTGFGFAPSDYIFNTLQRHRYDVNYNIPPESFQPKTIKQRDESVVAQPQTYPNNVYNNQNFRPSPQITQANARAFYNVFQAA